MDFDRMIVRANAMIRSYVAGNLVIGALLSAITALVFWQIGLARDFVRNRERNAEPDSFFGDRDSARNSADGGGFSISQPDFPLR